tara:strand:- start:33 stop:368 length:336 start_codon:yes stop_codon:yes gene_type:complete
VLILIHHNNLLFCRVIQAIQTLTHLAVVVQIALLATTTAMQPLMMVLASKKTLVAFVAVMASLTVPAIATATFLTSVAFVAVMALLVLASVSQSALVQALPADLLLHGHLC